VAFSIYSTSLFNKRPFTGPRNTMVISINE
jgi:hypothetical protein